MIQWMRRWNKYKQGLLTMQKLRLPAKLENLQNFLEFVTGYSRENGFAENRIQQIELAVEEALVNIFNYAYPDVADYAEVRCEFVDDNISLEIVDNGIPFNPLSLSAPDLSVDMADREVGGLGVFFIRKLTSDVQYCRDGESNIMTLTISK